MERFSRKAIHHLDAEGRERRAVVGLLCKETDGLLDEGVERLLGGKVGLIARYSRPKECRTVHRVVARGTLHRRKLRAYVVLDAFQFLAVVRPCHDVEVGADGREAEAVRFVQVLVDPLLVDLVRARIARERLHIAGTLLEPLQVLLAVVDQHILVVDVVTREEQPDGRGERQAAIAPVGREFFVTGVGRHRRGHILRIGERMQAEDVIADAHLVRCEGDVLQAGGVLRREGEVFFDQSGLGCRTGNLVRREAAQADEPRIVHDALELLRRLDELGRSVLIADLFGDDMSPAEGVPIALSAAALFGRLRQEQVTRMVEIGAFVEMSLERTRKEAHLFLLQFGLVLLTHEPILLMYDTEIGQHADRLAPCGVYRFVLGGGYGVQLR